MDSTHVVNFDRLRNGVGGYSSKKCDFAYQAALVCLSRKFSHSSVKLRVAGCKNDEIEVTLHWNEVVSQCILDSWLDEFELVEWGAVGIALMIIDEFTEYTTIRQAPRGTGVDFDLDYDEVASRESDRPVFAAHAEVSGILSATKENSVDKRRKSKWDRLAKYNYGDAQLHVIVAEFSEPMVDCSTKESLHEQSQSN